MSKLPSMTSKEFLILRMISSCTWLFSSSSVVQWLSPKDNSTSKHSIDSYVFLCSLFFPLSFGSPLFQTRNDVYIDLWKLLEVSRIGLNLERHHLASKVTPLGRIYNFQGNFVYPYNFISRKFLHKSCRTFYYLSRPTWII